MVAMKVVVSGMLSYYSTSIPMVAQNVYYMLSMVALIR